MEHYWLLTWSTYGTWVPQDTRPESARMAASAADGPGTGPRMRRGRPPVDAHERAAAARRMLVEPPVHFSVRDAEMVSAEFRETARIRHWRIFAGAITQTRIHLVVGVAEDPPASALLRDFKAYASRALNADRGYRRRWWTRSGATRPLRVEGHILAAIEWVQKRPDALVRISDTGEPPAPDGAPGLHARERGEEAEKAAEPGRS